MRTKRLVYLGVVAAGIAAFLASWPSQLSSQQGTSVSIDNDDIGGVVTSAKGPEAGVWVIAETTDLPTRFAKMVVTDDRGRYLLPDLPKANYNIWVRGYGLVDSPKVKGAPGKNLNLKAVVAPNEAAAAQILSGDLLVFHAQDSGGERVWRQGRNSGQDNAERLAQLDEEQRLHRLPSVGPARHAHVPARGPVLAGQVQYFPGNVVPPHSVRPIRRTNVQPARQGSRRRCLSHTSRTGRIVSPKVNCPIRSHCDRKASSATSSSPPGIGSMTSITFTT